MKATLQESADTALIDTERSPIDTMCEQITAEAAQASDDQSTMYVDDASDTDSSSETAWTDCTESELQASVAGFTTKRHTSGSLRLWRDAIGDTPAHIVGAPLWLRGMACNESDNGWCTVVDYIDNNQKIRRWLMPRSMLASERGEMLRALLDRGYDLARGKQARDALYHYVSEAPRARFTTTERTGWHGDSFVLPTRTVGSGAFLLAAPPASATLPAGSLELWRERVALPCRGNTRLTFAMSTSFASALLQLVGMESGGVHFVGGSSIGKSTAAHVARSVWGCELPSWRATDNGLEGIAARHSDIGLVLDEIGQVDGRIVGDIAYMLAHGQGKGRASRDGSDRTRLTWRVLVLSTGETTLAQHMIDAGKRTKAGQEIRLVSIEADAGVGLGLFENCHGSEPAAFADALVEACKVQHGHAGPEFIEHLVGDISGARAIIDQVRTAFERDVGLGDADGQVQRVARRFALIAAAGELATRYGLTGWEQHTAIGAAVVCFEAWRATWTPTGSHESAQAVEQVRTFLQKHASRFEGSGQETVRSDTRERAGVFFAAADEYAIFPGVFRDEVCAGLHMMAVIDTLESCGFLVVEKGGKRSARRKVGRKRQRMYVVRAAILEDDANAR